jgi:hypothetical protein
MFRRISALVPFALGTIFTASVILAVRGPEAAARPEVQAQKEEQSKTPGMRLIREGISGTLAELAFLKDFEAKRVSSYDPSGANADGRQDKKIQAGETRTLAEIEGAGAIHHIWVTIASREPYHLRKLVLRMYWDGESTPSVLAPIGDFFGTGHGEYTHYACLPMAIGSQKAMNCYWFMPFEKGAKITVENQGERAVDAFYYYIDYRSYSEPLARSARFHAHYRQAHPAAGFKKPGQDQFSPEVNNKPNTTGEGNYVILDTEGRGTYLGVAFHIVQNDDQWWGEGDDMIFIDGDPKPTLHGTGSEDYFSGAWCFGKPFSYPFFGNPRNDWKPQDGDNPPCNQSIAMHKKGAKWTVYRLHIPDPIPFQKSIRVTIEHGHANSRSDNLSSTAYWYQTGRAAPLPDLPAVAERLAAINRERAEVPPASVSPACEGCD